MNFTTKADAPILEYSEDIISLIRSVAGIGPATFLMQLCKYD